MKQPATFYVGKSDCSVCVAADEAVIGHLDRSRLDVSVVDVSANPSRIDELDRLGVKTLHALVIGGDVFHINLGITVADLKNQLGV